MSPLRLRASAPLKRPSRAPRRDSLQRARAARVVVRSARSVMFAPRRCPAMIYYTHHICRARARRLYKMPARAARAPARAVAYTASPRAQQAYVECASEERLPLARVRERVEVMFRATAQRQARAHTARYGCRQRASRSARSSVIRNATHSTIVVRPFIRNAKICAAAARS